ncbi:MAG TPA: lysophospholipid acyltransferase family protein [Anaerolineales bacterium]
MNLVAFTNSRWGPPAGISLVRLLPSRLASKLASSLANRLASQVGSPLVEAVRTNQAVVRDLPRDHPEVDRAVRTVLHTMAKSYLVLFRVIRSGQAGLREAGELDAALVTAGRERLEAGRGLLYAGAHTAGLDLLLLMIGGLGYPILALAYPESEASYVVTNRIRRSFGVDISPTNFNSLRQAIRHLRKGGMVATAVDRPDPTGELIEFFGRPARLLVGHARLAIRTGAPIMVGGTYQEPNGRYRAVLLDILESSPFADRPTGELQLAQEVMRIHERFIRQRPDQWMMFHPVWPAPAKEQ